MSRLQDIINRLELVAHKIGMSIEDAVLILEGKHPTHAIVQTHEKLEIPKPLAAETTPNAPLAPVDTLAPAATGVQVPSEDASVPADKTPQKAAE